MVYDFEIYSKPNCTYCEQAKALIKSRGLAYRELIIDVGQPKETDKNYVTVHELKSRVPDAKSVPQIFKGSDYVGGYDALKKILAA